MFKQAISNAISAGLGSRAAYPFALTLTKIGMRGLGINGGCELHQSGEQWLLERALPALTAGVVADVGANIGEFSRLARRLGAAQVLAFEPAEATYRTLVTNTVDDPSISCFRTAVGEFAGETEFYVPIDESASALASRDVSITTMNRAQAHKIRVPLTTLDLASGGRRLDIVKIDVEGFELDVLKGAGDLIAHEPPGVIMFEFNSHHLARRHTLPMFAELLSGYTFHRLARSDLRPLDVTHYLSNIFAYQNIVAVHANAEAVRRAILA